MVSILAFHKLHQVNCKDKVLFLSSTYKKNTGTISSGIFVILLRIYTKSLKSDFLYLMADACLSILTFPAYIM